jgi:uncharacterized membrane protein
MYTFNWIMCGFSLVALAMHLFFFARIVTDSRFRETRHRMLALMESMVYIAGMGLLFLAVWIPLRHHSGDMDARFLFPGLLLTSLPSIYPMLKKALFSSRLKPGQTPGTKQ